MHAFHGDDAIEFKFFLAAATGWYEAAINPGMRRGDLITALVSLSLILSWCSIGLRGYLPRRISFSGLGYWHNSRLFLFMLTAMNLDGMRKRRSQHSNSVSVNLSSNHRVMKMDTHSITIPLLLGCSRSTRSYSFFSIHSYNALLNVLGFKTSGPAPVEKRCTGVA
jgi:hypothetical protein